MKDYISVETEQGKRPYMCYSDAYVIVVKYEMTPLMITRYCYDNPGGIPKKKVTLINFNIYRN